MRPDNKSCKNCRFWEWGFDKHPIEEHDIGFCLRHAPHPTNDKKNLGTVAWPLTAEFHFCFEWKAK